MCIHKFGQKWKQLCYFLATNTLVIVYLVSFRYGLVVRIAGSHPAGPGSIPGNGNLFHLSFEWFFYRMFRGCLELNMSIHFCGFFYKKFKRLGVDYFVCVYKTSLKSLWTLIIDTCKFKTKSIARRKKISTKMGFEPTRAEPIGLAVQRLNHSATSSDRDCKFKTVSRYCMLSSFL